MNARPRNVFLTGASSGIGAALATRLLDEGHHVWGTSRDKGRLAGFPRLHPVEMTLEDPASVEQAWNMALAQAGAMHVVVQNAGAGHFGSIEEVSLEDSRRVWSVLVEGPLLILKLAAEHLRPRREGMIIGISSLAAEMPICFCSHYSAAKAAFSTLLAGLWMELKPFGVQVVDVRPGDFRTGFNDALPRTMPEKSAYAPWAQSAWLANQKLMATAPAPDVIAAAILRLLLAKKAPAILREAAFFQSRIAPLGPRLLSRECLLQSIRTYYDLNRVDARERGRE